MEARSSLTARRGSVVETCSLRRDKQAAAEGFLPLLHSRGLETTALVPKELVRRARQQKAAETWVRVCWRPEQTAGPSGGSPNRRKRVRPESAKSRRQTGIAPICNVVILSVLSRTRGRQIGDRLAQSGVRLGFVLRKLSRHPFAQFIQQRPAVFLMEPQPASR